MTAFLRFIQNNKFQQAIFFLLLLFLPTQFGKHFWPEFAFINGLRIDYLSPTIYLTDIFSLVFVFSVFSKVGRIPFSLLLGFIFLFLSIGIYLSLNPLAGWVGLLKLFEYILLGFAIKEFLPKTKATMLVMPLAIGIIGESLLAIGQIINQGSVGGIFYFLGERAFTADTPGIANASINGSLFFRPYATFPHPNVLAGYVLFGMTIILSLIAYETIQIKKYLYCLSFVLGTVVLTLSLSRVAIILWFLFVGYFLLHEIWKFLKKHQYPSYYILFFPMAIITTVIFCGLLFPTLSARFLTTSLTDESIISRIALIKEALIMIQKYPIFGVGFDNFFSNSSFIPISGGLPQPVHNIFLLIAAQTGIPIMLLVCLFLYKTFARVFGEIRQAKGRHKIYLKGVASCLIMVVIIGMVDHYPITLQQGQLLTTLIFSLAISSTVDDGR